MSSSGERRAAFLAGDGTLTVQEVREWKAWLAEQGANRG